MNEELTESLAGLRQVTLALCTPCRSGAGGECHSPGCSLYLNRAPDLPLTADPGIPETPGRFLDSALAAVRPHLNVVAAAMEMRDDGTPLLMLDGNLRASHAGRPAEVRAAYRGASEACITAVEDAGIEFEASPSVTIGSGDGTWPEGIMRMALLPPGTADGNGRVLVRHSAPRPRPDSR